MAMQPNNTTQVTAKAVSACRARMSGAIATTAVQPHTAVPMASSSPRRRGTASRRAMPMPAMSATVRQLRAIGSAVAAMAVAPPRVRRSPTSAMPTRSSRYMAQFRPLPAQAGTPMLFRHSMPSSTAHITGLKGIFGRPPTPSARVWAMPRATAASAMAMNTPGSPWRSAVQPGANARSSAGTATAAAACRSPAGAAGAGAWRSSARSAR